MQIRMKTTSAGPTGTMHAGRQYDVPDEEARDLIQCGAAAPVDRGTRAATAERAVGTDAPPAAVPPRPASRTKGPGKPPRSSVQPQDQTNAG